MCARFTLTANAKEVAGLFDLVTAPDLPPRYNIAPSQQIAAVRLAESGEREFTFFKWGLVPSWAADEKIGWKLLNARGETVSKKPSFRNAFRERRCLIPADGFYEWIAEAKRKKPFRFRRPDRKPFAFAGLWERWPRPGQVPLESCTIITTSANEVSKPFHERMPVIVPTEKFSRWLSQETKPDGLSRLIAPISDDFLTVEPVSDVVNSPNVDDPRCIEVVHDSGLFGIQ
jgi:putative SOS response-associated peptidase YedK